MDGSKRVVIVTGAGAGLGRAYALDLATRGMRVIVNNRRRELDADGRSSAERVVAEIRAAGGEALPCDADATDPACGITMLDMALQAWGRLDAVVANAGVDQHEPFHRISLEDFRRIFDVNFFGTLNVLHATYAQMRKQGHGRIVVSTSSAGLHGLHGLSSYSASKAALIGLMRSLAGEGLSRDVLCNAVAPYAATRMTEAHSNEQFAAAMPPQRVAPLVALLVSQQCNVTGQTIVAGGGGFRLAAMVEELELRAVPPDLSLAELLEKLQPPLRSDRSATFADALQAFADFSARAAALPH